MTMNPPSPPSLSAQPTTTTGGAGGAGPASSSPTYATIPGGAGAAAPSAATAPVPMHQHHQHPPPNSNNNVPPPPKKAKVTKKKKLPKLEDSVLLTRTPDVETSDGYITNREAAIKIRDAWMYKQVRKRQLEFTNFKTAHCWVGTWNVNAKGKPEDDISEWLCPWRYTNRGQQQQPIVYPDLMVAGFQEIVDLNAVNVAVDNKTQQRSQFWVEKITQTLQHPKRLDNEPTYSLVMVKSMVGLLMCVFCQQKHMNRVQYVHSTSVGVGVLGMGGNKGGVAVRLQFYDTSIALVCSHLAAHRENVAGRNLDYQNIFAKTNFDIGDTAIREVIRSGSLSHWTLGNTSVVGIPDHDIVIWLGDLNYRIDESMTTEQVLKLSESQILDELRHLDQLNVERDAGRAFENFEEGPLHFVPTYKYQPGTDMYEQRPDKKLRAPAWCDRILWMTTQELPGGNDGAAGGGGGSSVVQQMSYGRSERPNVSDHKPVYSLMRMTVKDVIQPKREAIYEELMRLLDRYENQTLPMVGLDRVQLDFGEIRYEQSVPMPIQITNTGSVVAQYRLVPKPDENSVCKPWLKVSPMFGMLIPGDQAATIEVTVTINKDTAQLLHSGREVLEDILILRLENGRDYYITIKAAFARSCFGMSVDELVLYSQPVRNVPIDPIERAKQQQAETGGSPPTALCVPKELWRLIDAIYEKGLYEPHLFVELGDPEEVKMIRESLDTGKQFGGPYQIHSYAEALVSFLSSLSSPIIPTSLFPATEIDSQNIQMSARRLLEELPPIHYNVFVYVISFFREVLQLRQRNHLTAAKVARICCSCMAPGNGLDNSNASAVKRNGMQLIVLHLLETASI